MSKYAYGIVKCVVSGKHVHEYDDNALQCQCMRIIHKMIGKDFPYWTKS